MNKIARTLSQFYHHINTKLAGWNVRIKIQEYLIQALLIVFSVILALFLNEYRNNLKAKNELDKTLANLQTEIENNRKILQDLIPYHQSVYNRLNSISQSDSAISTLKSPLIYGIIELFPKGLFPNTPGNSAWEVLLATGQLSQIEIDQAQHLSKLYSSQESIDDLVDEIYAFVVNRDILNESEVRGNLLILSLHLQELHQREAYLLSLYNESLAFLNQDQRKENHN